MAEFVKHDYENSFPAWYTGCEDCHALDDRLTLKAIVWQILADENGSGLVKEALVHDAIIAITVKMPLATVGA